MTKKLQADQEYYNYQNKLKEEILEYESKEKKQDISIFFTLLLTYNYILC